MKRILLAYVIPGLILGCAMTIAQQCRNGWALACVAAFTAGSIQTVWLRK